jgi:hypothetical protein
MSRDSLANTLFYLATLPPRVSRIFKWALNEEIQKMEVLLYSCCPITRVLLCKCVAVAVVVVQMLCCHLPNFNGREKKGI